jgi:hypothetical protein
MVAPSGTKRVLVLPAQGANAMEARSVGDRITGER